MQATFWPSHSSYPYEEEMNAYCSAPALATGPLLRDNGPQVACISFPAALPLMTADERAWRKSPSIPLSTLSILIKRSQRGDEGAMEKIYEHYKRPLFNGPTS